MADAQEERTDRYWYVGFLAGFAVVGSIILVVGTDSWQAVRPYTPVFVLMGFYLWWNQFGSR